MTTNGNPRTPQPGDVWEHSGGKMFLITDEHLIAKLGMLNIDNCRPSHHPALAADLHQSNWRYLGRASDLIGEALNNRKKEAPNE